MKISKRLAKKTDLLLAREKGTIYKDHGGKIRICLIYPNTYHVGMSNLGFRILYSLFNMRDDVVCERAFLPEISEMDEYEQSGTKIFTMESRRALNLFDIVAFSVSFENDYPNILKILQLSGTPLYSAERDARFPLILMGGPCAFMNPEPLSPFIDIIMVGEAECLIDNFINSFKGSADRRALYEKIRDLEGVYVPSFYEIEYTSEGTIKGRAAAGGFPEKITRSFTGNLEYIPYDKQIIAGNTEFSNMHLIEAMRGCPWSCRFCAAGSIYNPPRKKSREMITEEIKRAQAGTERIGIIGPSLTDYPHMEQVLSLGGIEFSITSLRASRKSADIVSMIEHKRSVSIAPEAGSERLRNVINKKIKKEDIIETASLLLDRGIETLKLYFMVGLPTETDDDVRGIIHLVKEIRGLSKKGAIVLSVSTFVPKPFTPFQWHRMEDAATVKERLKMLRKGFRGLNVRVFHDVLKYTYMEGLLAMGDRRVSKALEALLTTRDWRKACRAAEITPEMYISRNRPYSEVLPWDFIDNGTDRKALWDDYADGLREESQD